MTPMCATFAMNLLLILLLGRGLDFRFAYVEIPRIYNFIEPTVLIGIPEEGDPEHYKDPRP